MLTCKEASRRLSEAQDAPLPAAERLALEAHLRICAACQRAQAQFDTLRRVMRQYRDKR
jgi:anti-sigma factor RsiW